ncbi:MAG: DEAD/DEAH box helicase [Acidobacteriales bacterium]|nr:DEAD/DEAH box helicase [Terriglobales bacterium]
MSLPPDIRVPDSLAWAHPIVQEWFVRKFGTPTEPQEAGWPHILARHPVLISAPTGSGKTLAAFLACIDQLVRKALDGRLTDKIEVLYISPLKALGNDIQKNLEGPMGEILHLAAERGLLMPEIRTMVRTGDTLPAERRRMLKRPPHILVTTPESLYILLTAGKSRELLRAVETVIVDEIHAIADDKRGSHLSLSLERLAVLSPAPPLRIGLSATQKPIELVADFLIGCDELGRRKRPVIVDVGHRRTMDLAVEVPKSELGPICTHAMWEEIYDRIAELAREHRSTLVFVNTRSLTERIAHCLGERLGEEAVAAHHGSLSRKLRLAAENKLKNGEIQALVATASLELGIDIGFVDLVCHIGSPRSFAAALQRIGRAGHWRGAIPKGRFFPSTRDDLIECAAVVRGMRDGDLDRLWVPSAPLDILAQQIVAMCACQPEDEPWDEDDLLRVVRRAYPYRDLPERDYQAVLEMLSEGFTSSRGRYSAYLHRDRINRKLRARRGARLVAITNGGAIPDNALFTVVMEPEGIPIATLDEDFAIDSVPGDIILLGNTSWRVRRIEAKGRVLVEDAHGAAPTVPFWRGEAPGRTLELSEEVGELRQKISESTPNVAPGFVLGSKAPEIVTTKDWLHSECGLDEPGAEQAIEYVVAGRGVLRAVPTQKTVIAERFFDEGGGMQLVVHAPFGGRINKAWGLALRKKFCAGFNFELQAAATDNGINISLAEQHSFPLADVFQFLTEANVQHALEQASLDSPIFANRWRWDANRSLALLRFRNGKKVPPQIQRTRSEDLLASVFPDLAACQENVQRPITITDHPLVREVMSDVLTEAMDLEGLRQVLRGLHSGEIKFLAVDTPVPSQFSHEIINANPFAYLDDAPLEERRARAVELRRTLPSAVLTEIGRLDPAAIAEVRAESWPDVRDADELHDVLQTLVALPVTETSEDWPLHFAKLVAARRAVRGIVADKEFWVASERVAAFHAMHPEARFDPGPPLKEGPPTLEDALHSAVTGWLMHSGPVTANRLSVILNIRANEIFKALLRVEASGAALRGIFEGTADPPEADIEWCDRRLLARIHRLTLGALRKQVEPVPAATFMRWLLRWQHIMPGTQLAGERGLQQLLRQLQGFEVPANAWERQILARRFHDYKPELLDQLCLTGAVGWGRLSPHPATLETPATGARRVVPTSVAPITFYVRDEADWMASKRGHHSEEDFAEGLSPAARQVFDMLRSRGASFFADIVRGTEPLLKSEVETGLWELVAAGLVTADGFDNLRALIDPKRRAGQGRGKTARPRHSAGRWTLLHTYEARDHAKMLEATCRMLLERYGVVFRELLARESILPRWRELLITFRRLEDRGEVRGGRFVDGFLGEQFALPIAVDSLRALRNQPAVEEERITLSAADPLNLVGIVVPGDRVPAISGKFVSFRNGVYVSGEDAVTPMEATR